MSAELMGVQLEKLRFSVMWTLDRYQDITDGKLKFETVSASNLELTPSKPNSARSTTTVYYENQNIGNFYTIAFQPGDATGDKSSFNINDLTVTDPYPRHAKIVPRKKVGIHSEAHLTIVTYKIDNAHAEPILFSGSLDLLSLKKNKIHKIGVLGNTTLMDAGPKATLTTGYDGKNKRIGDPHSVFNNLPDTLQICAFLAIRYEINNKYGDILKSLNPQLPIVDSL